MTEKELKRLSRGDLLEMLLALSKENEQLRRELETLQKQLDERRILVEDCGTMAEAALKLNKVFEAAQAACEQYLYNIQLRSEQQKTAVLQTESAAPQQSKSPVGQARRVYQPWLQELMEKYEIRDDEE